MIDPPSQPPQDDLADVPIPSGDQRQHPRVVYRDPVRVSLIGVPHDPHPRALLAEDLSASGLALSLPSSSASAPGG